LDTDTTSYKKAVHQGHNVRFFREMRKMKQEVLADAINTSQTSLSRLEAQEKIDDETLEKIAKELNTSVEAIKNFDEEKAINIVSSTFQDTSVCIANQCTFNPIDKVVELYERMLKEKEDKINLLEQLLKDKK
jgi:transcriptional regulator with XRE-family HTH domain